MNGSKDYTFCEVKNGRHSQQKKYSNALTTAYNTLQYIKPVQLIVVWWMVHVGVSGCRWHFQAGSFTVQQVLIHVIIEVKGRYWMACCGFGRVLQTVLVSTYESKDVWKDWVDGTLCSDIS
jgi:hypothetical protein